MPYDDADTDDPLMLVGVALPAEVESVREMAAAFADEFASLGYDEDRILSLFRQPFYAGAHQAYRILGEPSIADTVRESVAFYGRRRIVARDASAGNPHPSLEADREGELIQIECHDQAVEEGSCQE